MTGQETRGPAADPRGCANPLWGCAKHALHERTCCQTAEVFVTEGDKRRIAEHTGRADFWEARAPSDPSYAGDDDDPAWMRLAFRADGTRPVLKRHANGDCTFLGPQGCTLPTDVRPLVCRMYPFDYTERGIRGVDGHRCPSWVVPPGGTLLTTLGMRREDAERWHRILYQELRLADRADV
jgi:Fe-S-cluster containining protein